MKQVKIVNHEALNGMEGELASPEYFNQRFQVRGHDVLLKRNVTYANYHDNTEIPYPRHDSDGDFRFKCIGDQTVFHGHLVTLNTIFVPKSQLDFVGKTRMKQFVFRRVMAVKDVETFGTYKYDFDKEKQRVTYESCNHKDISFPENKHNQRNEKLKYLKKHVIQKGKYFGLTTKRALRPNDLHDNQSISFSHKNFREMTENLDLSEGENGFKKYEMPYKGDLICGIVKENEKGQLYYSEWFNCSEQFYKLWTLFVYGKEHESIKNKVKKLLKRLDTTPNTKKILKFKTQKEMSEHFYVHRTEENSKKENTYLEIAELLV